MKTNIDIILELLKKIQDICKTHIACTGDCAAWPICHNVFECGPESWKFDEIKPKLEKFENA